LASIELLGLVGLVEVFIASARGRKNAPAAAVPEDGLVDTRDAIAEARKRGIDLVEIAPNAKPPVCKLIDY
jgi:hypothetical protein